jgi:hypothetical protein
MYPAASATANTAGSIAFRTSGNQSQEGNFVSGQCNVGSTPRYCNATITGINSSDFYVRLKAIYKPVSVYVQATDSGGTALKMQGAQAIVDATGKAQDVVRRIQVRVPLSASYYFPEFAVESGNTICKRYSIYAGGADVIPPTNITNDGRNNGSKDAAACQLPGQSLTVFPYN